MNGLYKCPQCSKCFISKFNLERHLSKKKSCNINDNKKKPVCNHCNKIFSSNSTLNRHIKKHICFNGDDNRDEIHPTATMNIPIVHEQSVKRKLGYIYLIREREFIRLNENTYKVGKTEQIPSRRLNGYPKGSEVLLFLNVADCHELESIVLKEFDRIFEKRQEYGREYYTGDKDEMTKIINQLASR